MNSFILGFFYELLHRISELDKSFFKHGFNEKIDFNYRKIGVEKLASLKIKVQTVINRKEDFLIEEFDFRDDLLNRYKTCNEEFFIIEQDYFFVLKYYGTTEVYFQKIVHRIYKETGQILKPPVVTSFFSLEKYFWAKPPYLLGIPANEEKNLLNLSDCYHEKGHFIAYEYEPSYFMFTRKTRAKINDYFISQIKAANSKDKPERAKQLNGFYEKWIEKNWLEEFLCDMIATYFIGPAYAYTHIKIVLSSNDKEDDVEHNLFKINSELHPADEARMRGVFAMLNEIGEAESITKINTYWIPLVEGKPQGKYYEWAYPDILLEELAKEIFDACRNYNLNSYHTQCTKFDKPISKLLNEAWAYFLNSPEKYAVWQQQILDNLDLD
jgi:hypothetical protein